MARSQWRAAANFSFAGGTSGGSGSASAWTAGATAQGGTAVGARFSAAATRTPSRGWTRWCPG